MNSITLSPASFADVRTIPTDIWGSITRYIERERDLSALFLTCTYMQQVVQLASVLSAPSRSFRRLLRYCTGNLEQICVRANKVHAEEFFKHVHTLNLSVEPHCSQPVAAIVYQKVFAKMAALTPNLSKVNFGGWFEATDSYLATIVQSFPKIQHLILADCPSISDAGMVPVANCLELCTLDVRECSKITNAGLRTLAPGIPQLRSLDVSECTRVNDAGMIPFIVDHKELRSLGLRKTGISDETLLALSKHCPHLTALTLDGCTISDKGLQPFVDSPRKWQRLAFSDCRGVSKNMIIQLVQQGEELVSLALNRTAADDEVLAAIRAHCPSLRSLAIGGCAGITQNGLLDFAAHRHDLSSLDIHRRFDVDPSAFVTLLASCPLLQHLDAHGSLFTDAILTSIGAVCSHLRSIDLSACPEISGSGVTDFLKQCPLIRSLIICNIAIIKDTDIEDWLKVRPELRYIDLGSTYTSEQCTGRLERTYGVKIKCLRTNSYNLDLLWYHGGCAWGSEL